jgi:hypothetical protein
MLIHIGAIVPPSLAAPSADEEVETAMLRAALDWTEARTPDGDGGSTPPPPSGDGLGDRKP